MSMYRLSRGCFVFIMVMLVWSIIPIVMYQFAFRNSLLGCDLHSHMFTTCEITVLAYVLYAPLYVFVVLPLMGLHLFTFKVFADPQQALIAVLGVIDLAVLILGLFVYPWLDYRRWRNWW